MCNVPQRKSEAKKSAEIQKRSHNFNLTQKTSLVLEKIHFNKAVLFLTTILTYTKLQTGKQHLLPHSSKKGLSCHKTKLIQCLVNDKH